MRDLVPLKVRIGRKTSGRGSVNAYPDFNKIDRSIRHDLDWSHYIDQFGTGWQYSRDGFGQGEDPHHQFGAFAVPEDFAREALKLFQGDVSAMTPAEWEKFYDEDAHADEEEETIASDLVQGILARVQLEEMGFAPEPSESIRTLRRRRLDPADDLTGINRNKKRYWKWFKDVCKVNITAIAEESSSPSPTPDGSTSM